MSIAPCRIFAAIPARMASTRFPGKPLAPILGKPMLHWVIEGVKKSTLVQHIFVATDHQEITNACAHISEVEVILTDSNIQSGTDRIYHALKHRCLPGDLIINVQGDEPLIQGETVDHLISLLLNNPRYLMATLANPLVKETDLFNQNIVKVLCNIRSEAIYFSRFPIPYSRMKPNNPFVSMRHLGIYAYWFHFLEEFCQLPPSPPETCESLEQLRALFAGIPILVGTTSATCLGVDHPEDISLVEQELKKRQQ
ncbi:MAG: 3-deoxy-manno-octulosonate cytidylyltransferase [Bdellovibrionaceae bacterium]|nr:3-deoxy-manno-octulosonate cytidylyltransferase [Pseudobdellovibrionaceae bacterium]MDW8189693.1 3-deoxy-manno-octulosonate cytidylyltransferase [Pseudobdellovibrionaceae bacterium]